LTPALGPVRRHARAVLALVAVTGLLVAAPAVAAGYKAQRFDSDIALQRDGAVRVTETIVFVFQSGTFTHVWREIPTDRTDGIEVLRAAMDGRPFSVGDGDGHISLTGRERLRVEWQFAKTGPSTHTFTLEYLARGVTYADKGRDEFLWQALPGRHAYEIETSHVAIAGPTPPLAAHLADQHRMDGADVQVHGNRIDVRAHGIRSDGFLTVRARYGVGTLAPREPDWKIAAEYARRFAARWLIGAAAVLGAALLLVFGIRPKVPRIDEPDEVAGGPPDDLPPALAAAVAAGGHAGPLQGIAVLVDLADRGALTVREMARSLGGRRFAIAQVPGRHDLRRHEEQALVVAFASGADTVSISRASRRLARSRRPFAEAVDEDLADLGLLDATRRAARKRVMAVSAALLALAAVAAAVAIALAPRFSGYPFAIPAALVAAGVIGLIAGSRASSLSDEGVARGARWIGFKRYLLSISRGGQSTTSVAPRWTAYAIALGLGSSWSRYLKQHPDSVPPWFVAAATDREGALVAWTAFVATSGAISGSSVGSAASAGAAGGGASGAG
jgi:hypothetical protein